MGYEYPEGAFNSMDYETSGCEFIVAPEVDIDWSFEFDYPEYAEDELYSIVSDAEINIYSIANDPQRVYELRPDEFEDLVAEVFRRKGFNVKVTPRTRDGGKDIIASYNMNGIPCKVYAIPVVFIIGWRGEPGIHDEPQHIYQGEVTTKLLDDMDIANFVIGKDTTDDEVEAKMAEFRTILSTGKDVAFVIRKGALTDAPKVSYSNDNHMVREEIIQHIVAASGEDPIISTTGKASRELFETRVANNQSHKYDFLTVGSMGHSSSIALGVAINKPEQRIWCIDGDGAVLMHMGSMAVLGANKPKNLIHVVINNGAHETVGGMPTVAGSIDLVKIAIACGYPNAVCVDNFDDLDKELENAKDRNELSLIEVKCSIGAREDLGRPTTTALENKQNFMEYLKSL